MERKITTFNTVLEVYGIISTDGICGKNDSYFLVTANATVNQEAMPSLWNSRYCAECCSDVQEIFH